MYAHTLHKSLCIHVCYGLYTSYTYSMYMHVTIPLLEEL